MEDSRRGGPATSGRTVALALILASAAVILMATLTPAPPSLPLPRWCVFCGTLGGLDFVLNIALFVPLGLGLAGLWKSVPRAVAVGLALSLAIEVLQVRVVPGRDASLGDLLSNALGTAVGAIVALHAGRLLTATGRTAWRLSLLWIVPLGGLLGASARLLHPAPPRAPLWVQWAQPKAGFDVFPGVLTELALNGIPVRANERLDPGAPGHPFGERSAVVRSTVTLDHRRSRGTALISRLAGPDHESFLLGEKGNDAIFRARLRAADARLRLPSLRLPAAFAREAYARAARTPGQVDTFVVEAVHEPTALVLRRLEPGSALETRLPLSIALGWSLLLPWDHALTPVEASLGSAAMLAVLFLPLAFWARRSHEPSSADRVTETPRQRYAAIPIFLGGVTVWTLSSVASLAALGVVEWGGAILGALTGWWAGSRRAT